jgi:hypothetical protein
MDVDDDDGTQQPRQVQDYGVEVDFDSLTEEERAVCELLWNRIVFDFYHRIIRLRLLPSSMHKSRNSTERLREWHPT